ncbi:MAG: AmmeMemoRadiSam system radical SAM enzyme [Candidatus Shapirobacteria bacterium]
MTKTVLFQKLAGQKVKCLACQRYCQIEPGKRGFCQTRSNRGNQLYSLTYGQITGVQIDPIEKKPLKHFQPGSLVASIGSWGCNFRCQQCLNYWSTWTPTLPPLIKISPPKLIEQILTGGWPGIAFTYNEPAINPEFVHDVAKLAKKAGLYTVMVTNGSWSQEALDYYGKFIDAANIDFKGWSEKTCAKFGGRFGQIPQMAKYAQDKFKIHLEITTLVIPAINDSQKELKKMTRWMVENLGPETPWHLIAFNPLLSATERFRRLRPPTAKELKKIVAIGRQAGLKRIYV